MRSWPATASSKPDIRKHHLLMCAPAYAVSDARVPLLAADAARWRALSCNVSGMQPEMVAVADLLNCTDEYMTSQLNDFLDSEGVSSVAHVSQLFSRIKSKFTSPAEAAALRSGGAMFFDKFGVVLAEVEQQWDLAMKWRSKRVAFAHPLLGTDGGINKQRLVDLEAAIGTQPGFAQVKLAAGAMIRAANQLMDGA